MNYETAKQAALEKVLNWAAEQRKKDPQQDAGHIIEIAFQGGVEFQKKHGFTLLTNNITADELPENGKLYIVLTEQNKAYLCRCTVLEQPNGKYNFTFNDGSKSWHYRFDIVNGGTLMENIGAWQRLIITK